VLGGGDCKYLIVLSPIIAYQVLIPILLIAMTFFASVYTVKWFWNRIKSHQVLKPEISFFGKMPFMWAMIPAILIMNFKG
jgi:Flp pilus assembly protein protease CpaA